MLKTRVQITCLAFNRARVTLLFGTHYRDILLPINALDYSNYWKPYPVSSMTHDGYMNLHIVQNSLYLVFMHYYDKV